MPRVSIITATYNRPEVLRWAIECVRAQTYTDWEHIIVGDACAADTEALVRGVGDSRLRFFNRETNAGEQSGPNNDGLALATGDLVAYLNHDDLWLPDHLESLVAGIDALNADLVFAPPVNVDTLGVPRCGLTHPRLLYKPTQFVPASLWLLRRTLASELGGWRPSRAIHATNPSQDFLVRAWRRGARMECVPHVTALILASGGRPNAYVMRDGSQHEALWLAMQADGFREQLLTRMVLEAERDATALRRQIRGWRGWLKGAVDRLLTAAKLHPDAVRNRLARKPKGHWIVHLRALRGLPPLSDQGRPE